MTPLRGGGMLVSDGGSQEEMLSRSPRMDGAFNLSPVLTRAPLPGGGASPRLGGASPRLSPGHQRKSSSNTSHIQPSLWSRVFPASTHTGSTLPTYGRPERARSSGSSPSLVLRNVVLRPLYLIGRRGPAVPIGVALVLFVVFLTYSTSPSTQSVKRRVQGAVGPYIPQRAADAISWRKKQERWGGDGALRGMKVNGGRVGKSQSVLNPPRKDGRMLLEEGKKHPIPALMERAKVQWTALQERQSKTFAQAVTEYVRRYGRRPPKGFDKWYAFARAKNVLLIDEFDLINNDFKIYHAFRPSIIRARVEALGDEKTWDKTWTMRVEKGNILREGPLADHARAVGVEDLMKGFVSELPDMTMVYNGHDGARIALTSEERVRLETLASAGEYDDAPYPYKPIEMGPPPHWGQYTFCPADSSVRAPGFIYGDPPADATGLEMPRFVEGSVGAIIESWPASMNVCENPQYRHSHSTTSWVYGHHPTAVLPLFTPGVQYTFGDVHSIITEQLELEQQHDPTWEERPFSSLQWRGQTSGPLWDKWMPWKTTHRARLHLLSHQETGNRKIVLTDDDDIAQVVEVPNYRLNPLFLDTGMVGPAVQCVQEDGTCDKMYEVFEGYDKRISFDRASLYKYVLDIDGNSWSGRFRRLMQSNAAVVKSTLFPEFWTDWAIPWLHYIPMQVDYSDMWDILAFFRGGLSGEGAHDALAKEIAMAGKEWVRQCYRWEDLETYQYRLLLEYGRLYNDETSKGSNDFHGDESIEPIWTAPVVRRDLPEGGGD